MNVNKKAANISRERDPNKKRIARKNKKTKQNKKIKAAQVLQEHK